MANIEFRCRRRYQLLIPMFPGGRHVPGVVRRWIGLGTMRSSVGVGRGVAVTSRHNAVRDLLFRIGKEVEAVVTREPPLPVRVVGFETRRPDLIFLDWEWGAGSLCRCGGNLSTRRLLLGWQPPRVVFRPFAFETFGGFDTAAEEFLKGLQGMVNQALVAHEDLVWFSTHRRVSFAIARAVGWQLAARLPYGGVDDRV
eukprot:jgi/Botrbrau1/2926/Bobra.0026s0003.1